MLTSTQLWKTKEFQSPLTWVSIIACDKDNGVDVPTKVLNYLVELPPPNNCVMEAKGSSLIYQLG
jgi:hypothetical protein